MKQSSVIRIMTEVALFAAIGFVLDELQGAIAVSFPNGGSIGFAMVAVLFIVYRRGVLPGVLTGLIIGLFDIATKAYVLHPLQVMFDYILPYALVGLAGLFKPLFEKAPTKGQKILWLVLGTVLGGLLKLTSHFIAGVVWWGDPEYFAWGLNSWNVYLYSLVYNLAFIGPSIVLSSALMILLFVREPGIFAAQNKELPDNKHKKTLPVVITSIVAAIGVFMFIFFLVRYINSYTWKESSSKYKFSQDSMVNFITGLALIATSVNAFIMLYKNKFRYRAITLLVGIIAILHVLYSASHIIAMYIEEYPENYYWIWFSIALVLAVANIFLAIKERKKLASS